MSPIAHPPAATAITLAAGIAKLTAMERLFIRLCCDARGLPYKLIALDMGISLSTLHTHRKKVFRKLQVTSRSVLMLLAMREGLG